MGAHSFSSVNALYLHGVRHPNLLTGACYQDCHAFVRYAIALSKDGSLRCPTRLRGAKRRRRRTAPGITGQSFRTYAAMRNRFMFPHAAIHHSRRSRQARSMRSHSLRADRPWALRPTRRLAQFAPAWEEELWCSRPVSACDPAREVRYWR